MKITDETKKFRGESSLLDAPSLKVSSNRFGTHETPSLCLHVKTGDRPPLAAAYGTSDPEQIKEIIEHMAKMAGLTVTFAETPEPVDFTPMFQPGGFTPKYQKGDRVRSLMPDEDSVIGTVLHDEPQEYGWNVRVMLDGQTIPGLFAYDELEPVTKSV